MNDKWCFGGHNFVIVAFAGRRSEIKNSIHNEALYFNGIVLSTSKYASDTRLHDFSTLSLASIERKWAIIIWFVGGKAFYCFEKLHVDHQIQFNWISVQFNSMMDEKMAPNKRISKNNEWYLRMFICCWRFFSVHFGIRLYLDCVPRLSVALKREWWNHK